jgi:magnesium transporter
MKRRKHSPRAPRKPDQRQSRTVGLPPGMPVLTAEPRSTRTTITAITYDVASYRETALASVRESEGMLQSGGITWLDICGLNDVAALEQLGQRFALHPLIIEDIANTGQRPKFEDYGDVMYVVLRHIRLDAGRSDVQSEQISLILGRNFVVSIEEQPSELFNPVRERIRKAQGRIRGSGADYLLYRLVDAVVDNYYVVLEKLGDDLEDLEDELIEGADRNDLTRIHYLRRQMIFLRKAVWPLRDVIASHQHGESALILRETALYFRDVYDHTVQALDTIETYRERLSDMMDIYLTGVDLKLNEVMKVLTIISTIFLPLSFLAGVWGMNFQFMPELAKPWGYPAALAVMALTVTGMLVYFRRRGWI